MGLYQASAKAGPAIGAPLIAWLLLSYGWRAMFIVVGFGSLIWILPWMLIVRDNDRELEAAVLKRPDIPAISFTELLLNRAMIGIIIGSFCYNYYNYFCLTWLPSYFAEQRGLSLNSTGWFTGFGYWGFAVVSTAAGYVSDILIRRGAPAIRIRRMFIIAGFLIASTRKSSAPSHHPTRWRFFSRSFRSAASAWRPGICGR